MKRPWIGWLAAAAALLAVSCLSPQQSEVNVVDLIVPDSLQAYDTVRVIALEPGTRRILDTLWNAPVKDSGDLRRLRADHYRGGDLDIAIIGVLDGREAYSVMVEYRANAEGPKVAPHKFDSLPPSIRLRGPDSTAIRIGEPLPDTGCICSDDRPGRVFIIRKGEVDASQPALYLLEFSCSDPAGNLSGILRQRILVRRWPDTLPPVLFHPGSDSLDLLLGAALSDSGIGCEDAYDGAFPAKREGAMDAGTPGLYPVTYRCMDSAGNSAPAWTRMIRVHLPGDTLRPLLALRGQDSVLLYQGQAYADSGAVCVDERDGVLPVKLIGAVDPSTRGTYTLGFSCVDKAGNASTIARRLVRVAREPDFDSPILSLRGPDSLDVFQGLPYADSGAACQDARDGALAVTREGSVDAGVRAVHTLRFYCSDSAGNTAEAFRKVRVIRVPDAIKPILSLIGKDSLTVYDHAAYADSGASCLDDRDGSIAVIRSGTVNTAARGRYVLDYACSDSAGNAAEPARRIVRVERMPDAVKPILALRGPDSLDVFDGAAYADSGATCADDRDGVLPVSVTGAVNTAIRGRYVLAFACADSAGNAALPKQRVVRVVRKPDLVAPVIALKGKDSVQTLEGQAYVDSGATCADDRDGARPVAVTGTINTALRGFQSLTFKCSDSAGNAAAERKRSVQVIRVPDPVKPVLTLLGSAALNHPQGQAYADAGAKCDDARDGSRPVTMKGSVNVSVPGPYVLKFGCSDSAGNAADTLARTVTVVPPPDVAKPVITLAGPDSIPVVGLAWYVEPGVTCNDARDGAITPVLGGFDPPTGPSSGYYRALYSCADKAGNKVDTFRVVKAGLYTTNLLAHKDGTFDTTETGFNMGYNGMLAMSYASGDKYGSIFQFDFAAIAKTGLKSAKLRFVTWARHTGGSPWPGTRGNYTFNVYAVKRQWVEGTGNWFWHNGGWANGGQEWFFDYWLPTWVTQASTDPAEPSGITGADRDLIRAQNLTLVKRQTNSQLWRGDYPSSMASPPYLEIVEIDVTAYVKNTSPANHFGFFVTQEGAPDRIGILSREVDDGKWAARLMLGY